MQFTKVTIPNWDNFTAGMTGTVELFKIPANSVITKQYRDGPDMCFEYESGDSILPSIQIGTKEDEDKFSIKEQT